ncbi:hypothetical protein [Streptomyces sp. NPDC001275]
MAHGRLEIGAVVERVRGDPGTVHVKAAVPGSHVPRLVAEDHQLVVAGGAFLGED